MSGDFLDRVRERLGFQQYDIDCPGVSDPRTGIEIEPHEAKLWTRRQPKEGTYCRNCVLIMASIYEDSIFDPWI